MGIDAEPRRSPKQPAGARPGRGTEARTLFEAAEELADQAQAENDAEQYHTAGLTGPVAARARRARPQTTEPEIEP